MGRHAWSWVAGAGMVLVGLVLVLAFGDVDTPVIGLREAGVVLVVLGVLELGVATWDTLRSRHSAR